MIRSAKAAGSLLWMAVRFCLAVPAGQSSSNVASSSHDSLVVTSTTPSTDTSSASLAEPTNAVGNATIEIPGLVRSQCQSNGMTAHAPCVAICPANGTDCLRAASAEVQTCSPLWQDYLASAFSASHGQDLGSAWTTSFATVTPTVTATETIYTTFSPASDVFTIGLGYGVSKPITYTPVYALGDPMVSTYTSLDTINAYTLTEIVGPTPTCRFTRITTDAPPTTNCGQCTMIGGTVELFYWPTTTNNSTNKQSSTVPAKTAPMFTVLNGTTLRSPTAYISFQTAYATNSCSRVGMAHTGAIIGLPPSEVSTLVHWGGKAAASGANQYGPINYADLTGLPLASVYESQQSCQIAGCRTIYPSLQPTLVVPSQMRALDEAWKNCGLGLEGLYDPPVALTPQAVMAVPTVPASYPSSTAIVASSSTTMPAVTSSSSATTAHLIAPITPSDSGIIPDPAADASTRTAGISSADPANQPLSTGVGTSWPATFTYQPTTSCSDPSSQSQSGSTSRSHSGAIVEPGTSSTSRTMQTSQASTASTEPTTNALSVLLSALPSTSLDSSPGLPSSAISQTSVSIALIETATAVFESPVTESHGVYGMSSTGSVSSSAIAAGTSHVENSLTSASVPASGSAISAGYGVQTSPGSISQTLPASNPGSQISGISGSPSSTSFSTGTAQRSSSLPVVVVAPGSSPTSTAAVPGPRSSTGGPGRAPTSTAVESSGVSNSASIFSRAVMDYWLVLPFIIYLTGLLFI